jgi:hypothetical protein
VKKIFSLLLLLLLNTSSVLAQLTQKNYHPVSVRLFNSLLQSIIMTEIAKQETGGGYTLGINSGWNFNEEPFKGMIGPAK